MKRMCALNALSLAHTVALAFADYARKKNHPNMEGICYFTRFQSPLEARPLAILFVYTKICSIVLNLVV